MSNFELFLCVLGMFFGTALLRVLPITFLSKRAIPKNMQTWLSFVPIAILSALVAPEILIQKGELWVTKENVFLLAAVPTFIAAYYTKSLFFTLSTGMICTASLRYFLG